MTWKETDGEVYVIRHEHGFCKIGKGDPSKRRRSLQIGSPYRLYLFTSIQVSGDPVELEARLHDHYDEYAVRGEWFELPDDALERLAKIDHVHTSEFENDDEWTPEWHLSLTDEERQDIRASATEKQLREAEALIRRGAFPEDNVDPSNEAVKRWAEEADTNPRVFAELLADRLRDEEGSA